MRTKEALLALTRIGIGNYSGLLDFEFNWPSLQALASQQGLSAVVLDGIEKLPDNLFPPQGVLLEWIGEVLQSYELRYEQYCKAISEMAGFYNRHGYKMMILKGYACSLDWPKPNRRPCGDIDIWQFGKYYEAERLLSSEEGVKIDSSHHHHTVFYWNDFMVENHYDFVNVHDLRSSRELERIFKELGKDDTCFVLVNDEKVYLPSPNLHALFLLRHAVSHFASSNINIRQVLDWGFFVKNHTKEIDWEWLLELLDRFRMRDFYNCLNAICVDDLGFDNSIFPEVRYLPDLKDKILEDIFNPAFGVEEPEGFVPRMIYKYKRWQGNAWKQEFCYHESRWEMFWRGLWAHLIRPTANIPQ